MPHLLLIPGLPLLAFAILICCGRRVGQFSAWISVAALASSCALALSLGRAVFEGQRVAVSWAWWSSSPRWTIGLLVDGLSWIMLLVVTVIGTLIQGYSIGYMHGDPRFSRFFAYLSLFCASMLGLVIADHFVLLYACWELVGLCSYLLISFWFEKPAAAQAGRKAFLTTRIGDTGLLLGILLLWWTWGSLRFDGLANASQQLSTGLLTTISLLIFLGAVGKSAQIPLHVWLPDAMEGPTPVSALIHAATMVAAGVYLVARTFPLFTPESLAIVLGIGLATHLFAGTVALTMTDIKRVLAYSTISQLGLMMTALGLGAMPLAMFHLVTHAFFKALLFLGAGSVIHATHQQELVHLGGLARAMPITAVTFLIAALSMSGVFPLSGFWSKDAILLEARHEAVWVFCALLAGAVMTTAYIFRLYLRCFHGTTSSHAAHLHARPGSRDRRAGESPAIMTIPLVLLAVGAVTVGLMGAPGAFHHFGHLVGAHEVHEGFDVPLLVLSLVIAGFGMWLAWQVGVRYRTLLPAFLRPVGRRVRHWAANKYFVDECYDRVIVRPFVRTTRRLLEFDQQVIDAAVDGAGRAGWWLGQLKDLCDRRVVDRAVNDLAQGVRAIGQAGRRIQTGLVQQYLLWVVGGAVALSLWLRYA